MLLTKKYLLAIVSAFGLTIGLTAASPALSQSSQVLNLYSARHYQTDEALYAEFTKQTGIKINRIEADDNALLERLRSEGKNSLADVILLVDAARLWRAEVEGFLNGWCRCDLVPEAGATTVSLLVGTEESSQGISVEEVRDYLVANLNAIEWPN